MDKDGVSYGDGMGWDGHRDQDGVEVGTGTRTEMVAGMGAGLKWDRDQDRDGDRAGMRMGMGLGQGLGEGWEQGWSSALPCPASSHSI